MMFTNPLIWPPDRPRTKLPTISRFRVTGAEARSDLEEELRKINASNVILSSNLALGRTGVPLSSRGSTTSDTGVALYFTRNGKDLVFSCDRWYGAWDNVRAIGLTLNRLRDIDRWGTESMVDAAFAGYAALPAGDTSSLAWWDVLGISATASPNEINAAYLRRAKETHPDSAGGRSDEFIAVQEAYKLANAARMIA